MATEAKKKGRGPTVRTGLSFINKAELAREIGIDRKTLDRRIAEGVYPPPHSRQGERIAIWRRKDYLHFVDHGTWPAESFRLGSG
jgi:predicted DNA-binding transcriptional regulator AlpA